MGRIRSCRGRLTALAVVIAAVAPASAGAATIAPSTGADAGTGNCTLREAIESINQADPQDACVNTGTAFGASDTVDLAPGLIYTVTSNNGDAGDDANATGDLDLLEDMTIAGDATNPPSLDFNQLGDADRVIHVPAPGASLALEDLRIRGGTLDAPDGSGFAGGNVNFAGGAGQELVLDGVEVLNATVSNMVSGGERGAGVAALNGGSVVIRNGSRIANNTIVGTDDNDSFGGGIAIGGAGTDLEMSGSVVDGNSAGASDGATEPDLGVGGGLYVESTGASSIEIDGTDFTDNQAGGDHATGVGTGGGIGTSNGSTADITISGGDIAGNAAGPASSAPVQSLGGGIYVAGTSSSLNLDGVLVSENSAGGNGGTGAGVGGGISSIGPVEVRNSRIEFNDAGFQNGTDDATDPNGQGGGISVQGAGASLTVASSTISSNRAGENLGNGGAINMGGTGAMTISDSAILVNQAGLPFGGGLGQGGGINRNVNAASDLIARTVISGNSVGGAGATTGGGLDVENGGSVEITDTTVSSNSATSGNALGVGGGLSLDSVTGNAGVYTLRNTTVHGNVAGSTAAAGGTGGGIAIGEPVGPPQPSVGITHSTITANTAQSGAATSGGNLRIEGNLADSVGVADSILADGVGDPGEENCSQQGASVASFSSIEGPPSVTTQCGFDDPASLVGDDPLLGPLSHNAGRLVGSAAAPHTVLTRALSQASPAVDMIALCAVETDARGATRLDGACDAGAYERTWIQLTSVAPASGSNDNTPQVIGAAQTPGNIRIYTDPGCAGPTVATGSAAQLGSGIEVSVADNTTTSFYATVADPAGAVSPCTGPAVTYTERSPKAKKKKRKKKRKRKKGKKKR